MASGPGALSVALNNSGILGFANGMSPALLEKFKGLEITDPPTVSQKVNSTTADITLTGGSFDPTALSFSNMKQGSDGEFTVDAVLTGKAHFSKWLEQTTTQTGITSFESSEFVITFQSINITITVKIQNSDDGSLVQHVTGAHITDTKFTFTLPPKTALTSSSSGCITDKVNGEISKQSSKFTDSFVSSVGAALNDAFSALQQSGKLTNDIDYLFQGTPGGLVFPNNNGIQYRVFGKAHWKGEDAPGNVGDTAFPPIPSDSHDAIFFASSYMFDALFWAFYKQGTLNFSFNTTNVPSAPALTTNYYKDGPLRDIAEKYPNRNMVVDLELYEPPSVVINEGEAQLAYSTNLTFWVTKEGSASEKEAELFMLRVTETDTLERFSVTDTLNHLLLCHVNTIKDLSVQIVTSNVPYADQDTLELLWRNTLHPVYTDTLDVAVAQTGVPLLTTSNGYFTNYQIELHAGYVSAAVKFASGT